MTQIIVNIDFMGIGEDNALEVEFGVSGEYIAQTMTDPAEYPEIELYKVTWAGDCVIDNLSEANIKEIEKACWEHLAEEAENARCEDNY